MLQRFAPLTWRPPKALFFARRPVAPPVTIRVPTRHGSVRCFVYHPPADAPHYGDPDRARPVHVHMHGGGFYGRYPAQDAHLATYLASDAGAFVVTIDYDVTPHVQYPVAEEQCYDVVAWLHANAEANGWDAERISVGGASAGGKLAINVCQIAHQTRAFRPCALVAAYAVADVTRSDKTSPKRNAALSPLMLRISNDTYFADTARRTEVLASPAYDRDLAVALPATLILTGADDVLGPEMDALAGRLAAAGVTVTHRRFPGTDHGFTNGLPVATARAAIHLIGEHLIRAFERFPETRFPSG